MKWAGLVMLLSGFTAATAASTSDAQVAGAGGVGLALRDGRDPREPRTQAVVALLAERNIACAGSLVSPRMVLTAASCVLRIGADFSCFSDGSLSLREGEPGFRQVEPQSVEVYAEPDFDGAPRARGTRIHVLPISDIGCANQVALVQLDRPLSGTPVLPMGLHQPVVRGAQVRALGHAVPNLRAFGLRRNQVEATVLEVDSDGLRRANELAYPGTFALDTGICSSDRGGPVLDDRGEIIGVLFGTAGLDVDACLEPEAIGLATRLSAHVLFIRRAFTQAGEPLPGSSPPPSSWFACRPGRSPVGEADGWGAWCVLIGVLWVRARRRPRDVY